MKIEIELDEQTIKLIEAFSGEINPELLSDIIHQIFAGQLLKDDMSHPEYEARIVVWDDIC